ncbi:TolC family protein [Singulisphaera sp. PoT]|uniref:TolC family protein n=1 Tax=Singulisphaera sp. PoT TaxID=3411797 RepID=UPI003BF4EC30
MEPTIALLALVLAADPGDIAMPKANPAVSPHANQAPAAPSFGSTSARGRIPKPATPQADPRLRRTQATPADMGMPIGPGADATSASTGNLSLSLQQALTGALTSNPDLVALRQGNPAQASAEAVEVARRFPTTLNPTVFIDYRPITQIPRDPFGGGNAGNTGGHFYHPGQGYLLVAIRQPIELGHQTTHRYGMAKAAYKQVQWQVVQAELTVLVQTARFFQTATYRREKLRVAEQLADFNERALKTLERRLEANQALAADVSLARVESRANRQLAKAARQDYMVALTDLRNQIGVAESAAEVEPQGEFTLIDSIPMLDEPAMIQAALSCRPDLHVAQAAIEGAMSATKLAKGDMIPTTIFGPQYVQDEAGIQYVGFNLAFNLPTLNTGRPLVHQREAEERRAVVAYQQIQQRAVAQVRAAVAKWNGARELVNNSSGLTKELAVDVASLERLFEAAQTDLTRVQQARQRLIQLENAQLDALWAATQAQSDLMQALGVPSMIQSLLQATEAAAGVAPPPAPAAAPPPPIPGSTGSPFTPPR